MKQIYSIGERDTFYRPRKTVEKFVDVKTVRLQDRLLLRTDEKRASVRPARLSASLVFPSVPAHAVRSSLKMSDRCLQEFDGFGSSGGGRVGRK
jgi:hypothetical protein